MFDLLTQIQFSTSLLLLSGLIPFLILLALYIFNSFGSNTYCDKAFLKWVIIQHHKSLRMKILTGPWFALVSWLLFSIALAVPRINIDERSTDTAIKYNKTIVIVLDLSKSMLAQDIYPDRISKAKLAIEKILAQANGYLVSLVVFSNNAHVAIPLTYDKNVILNTLAYLRPNMLPVNGTKIIAALNLSATILQESNTNTQTVAIISDGDFKLQKEYLNNIFENKSVVVHSIGIGTQEGQAIPDRNGGWISYKNRPVLSKLNSVTLKTISKQYNGLYINDVTLNQEKIKRLVPRINDNSQVDSRKTIIIWQQVAHWFLIPGLMLFFIASINYKKTIAESVGNSSKSTVTPKSSVTNALILLFTATILIFPEHGYASDIDNANALYFDRNYIKAETAYKNIKGYNALIGQANAVYKQKNYQRAIQLYTQAILHSRTDKERSVAIYNLANTYYIIGDFPQSISIYKDALLYYPELESAKINLEYAIIINEKVRRAIALRAGKATSVKPGSGPRSEKIEDGVDIGNSKVTLSNEPDDEKQPLYTLNIPNEEINQLIQRGIKHSNVSSSEVDTDSNRSQWQFEYTTLDMIERLVKQEKIDSYVLWKRLFEIEAGFPAPVDTPHEKPGVQPW